MHNNDMDVFYMREAMRLARKAASRREVPVGAVIVNGGGIIARGYNQREIKNDPLAHAEARAIKRAAAKLKSWRLAHTTLYVTLEPCLMCMGAIILSRIPRLVFAAFDPKAGACGSLYDLSNDPRLNHRVQVKSGVMSEESGDILKAFFAELRKKRKDSPKG